MIKCKIHCYEIRNRNGMERKRKVITSKYDHPMTFVVPRIVKALMNKIALRITAEPGLVKDFEILQYVKEVLCAYLV